MKDNRLELYQKGLSDNQISLKLNLTRNAITRWRNKNNLVPNFTHHGSLGPRERFFSIIVKRKNGCWERPTGWHNQYGYSRFYIKNKGVLCHRFSYEIHNGVIPKGMYVLHTCDNRGCVNPDHLYLGKQKQNMHDSVVRKTHMGFKRSGEKHPCAKLKNKQVKQIRKLKNSNISYQEIGNKYGVSKWVITDIMLNRTYRGI